ncbi:mechanosensitive ion channel family protein [Nitrososphaera viennensis]|uniref:Mechanosensitive ion channel n=2 Tax=Nitrososphaera viennensis TaxID=1034015 RepID=A0A977ICF4_9ARCH|nr:mechanosensitive ion channel domain-containing protein [Nitrososphaera viennensis]UVS68429.1 mechanosensitive ion channel [Nitrososphaera viennensis]
MSGEILDYWPIFSILFSSMGISFVFKDYIADLLATVVIKKTKDIKPGTRIKVTGAGLGTTKGDVMDIGILRTTVMEVGDGERLPSVRTGRLIKVPNYMLINNPVMIYGDTIIDEAVAYVPRPYPDTQLLIDSMKDAIVGNGHGLIEVGLYQKDDRLIIHGVFEVKTSEMGDERSKILKDFLIKSRQISPVAEAPKVGTQVAEAGTMQEAAKPAAAAAAEKVVIPLANAERDD